MPQMSPMMWLPLFILFSMTMIMFNQMNFFSFKMNKISLNENKFKNKNKNYKLMWKW
uniref:ATP synthase F0 subunit 8 n=1 Tax=Phymateus saxosus TaxID=3097017 RepID=UPI002E76F9D1|nr:ATP synthase F0 subunit 8 [Phymateus saxosus]WPS66393.1 ATP synthase F0 subunit 8 [Phymateus saxosus]